MKKASEKKVKESPNGKEFKLKITPDKTNDPIIKFNEEIWEMVMELIKKLQANTEKGNNLSVFIALKAPDIVCADQDGNPANAIGFTSGRMLNIAEMVNEVLDQHKELTAAMEFDRKAGKLKNIMETIESIKELLVSKTANNLKV